MSRHDTARRHDQLIAELNEERAAALRRISRTLETLIDQLHVTRERLRDATGGERQRELEQWDELHRRAVKYRWFLEVQREALGLRHHHHLDEFYRIPALTS